MWEMDAKRAGWAEPGKRTRENHAILVPRRDGHGRGSAQAVFAKEVYLTEIMNLRAYMVQLATGEHDAMTCQECGKVFRAGWMGGKCPYCEAEPAANYVGELTNERRSACGREDRGQFRRTPF